VTVWRVAALVLLDALAAGSRRYDVTLTKR
jgi:hypothetical protein